MLYRDWRDFWRQEAQDLRAKLWLYPIGFVLLVVPATAMEMMGFPLWFVWAFFVVGFLAIYAIWLVVQLWPWFRPWLEAMAARRDTRTKRDPNLPPELIAPRAEVVEITPDVERAVLAHWVERFRALHVPAWVVSRFEGVMGAVLPGGKGAAPSARA